MTSVVSFVFEPGWLTSTPVQTAAVIGGGAALVSAVVGVFTIIRGQSFAGHALLMSAVPAGLRHFCSESTRCSVSW